MMSRLDGHRAANETWKGEGKKVIDTQIRARRAIAQGVLRDSPDLENACGEDRGRRDKGGIPIGASVMLRARARYLLGRRASSSHGGLWRASERVSSCCVDRSSP